MHRHLNVGGQCNANPAFRVIDRFASERAAGRELQHHRHFHGHAVHGADLPAFARSRDTRAEDQHVVAGPREIEDRGLDFAAYMDVQIDMHEPGNEAEQIQQQQEQIGPRDRPVEIVLFDLAALGGHVELAELRVDQREQRRRGDVRGQHRFIHLRPERMPEQALHARVGDARVHHVRQRVDGDAAGRRFNHMRAKKQERQGRSKKHQPRDAVEEVHHRVQVAQTLADLQAFAGQRIVDPENLRHAARPADALADVPREAFGGEPCSLRDGQIRGRIAEPVQLQGGVGVFGDGLHRNAADLLNHRAAQQRARAAEEGGVPQVVAVLHETIEQFAFVRHLAEGAEIALERIG